MGAFAEAVHCIQKQSRFLCYKPHLTDTAYSTIQVYYSQGSRLLEAVTGRLPNNNTGGGQFQVGMLKKPTETTSVVYDGFQEKGIYEGQIYGGVFIEDSAGQCVSV